MPSVVEHLYTSTESDHSTISETPHEHDTLTPSPGPRTPGTPRRACYTRYISCYRLKNLYGDATRNCQVPLLGPWVTNIPEVSQCRNWPSDDYAWTRKDAHAAITQCHNGPWMSMHGHRTQWSSSAAIGPWMRYTPTTKLSKRLDSTHGFEGGCRVWVRRQVRAQDRLGEAQQRPPRQVLALTLGS